MAATLLKICWSLILKYPNHVSKCNIIGKRKINFHTTAKNFEVKCDVSAFFDIVNLICNVCIYNLQKNVITLTFGFTLIFKIAKYFCKT